MKLGIVAPHLAPTPVGQAVILSRLIEEWPEEIYSAINTQTFPYPSKLKKILTFPFTLCRNLLKINRLITHHKCNAILVCSGDFWNFPLSYLLARLHKTPLHLYFFDDYIYQWPNGLRRKIARKFEVSIVEKADSLIVPNSFLGEEYKKRYGISPHILPNPIEIPLKPPSEKTYSETGARLKILYSGSIYHAHYDAFENLIVAVKSLVPSFELHIYTASQKNTPSYLSEIISGANNIFVYPSLPSKDICKLQSSVDLLFLPLAFNSPISDVIKTSAPGKIAEYLVSGKPILVHAPKNSFSAWYFEKYQCGFVVSKDDPNALIKMLRDFKENPSKTAPMIQNAYLRAKEDFCLEKSRELLKSIVFPTISEKETPSKLGLILFTPSPPETLKKETAHESKQLGFNLLESRQTTLVDNYSLGKNNILKKNQSYDVILLLDLNPFPATFMHRGLHPALDNARLLELFRKLKKYFRANESSGELYFLNDQQTKEFLKVSSFNLREVLEEKLSLEQTFKPPYPSLKKISGKGTSSKVEIINYNDTRAVQKAFLSHAKKNWANEVDAYQNLTKEFPEIPALLESGSNYIIIPFYQDTLQYAVNGLKLFPLATAKKVFALLKGLHEQNIAHLDCHPGNVLKLPNGEIKLIDFEYLYKYHSDKPLFLDSYTLKGFPPELEGAESLPTSNYKTSWQPHIGLTIGSLLYDPVWLQHLKRNLFFIFFRLPSFSSKKSREGMKILVGILCRLTNRLAKRKKSISACDLFFS